MKTYNLDEEQFELVSTAIAEITQICKKVEAIDAIYMTKFHQVVDEKEIPTINIVPVYTEISFGKRNKKTMEVLIEEKDNEKLELIIKNIKEKKGIKVLINPNSHYNYSILMRTFIEYETCRHLYNGNILFDRNGKYTDMKNKLINKFNIQDVYNNAIEFKPTLTLIKTN